MADKNNKLNVYLIKDGHTDSTGVVRPGTTAHPIEGVGTYFGKDSHSNTPDWALDFFGGVLRDRFKIFSASPRGVLVVPVQHGESTRLLALTFGLGRHLLREDVIEEGFGLRTVLNSVIRTSLRSIDKTTLGSVPKQSREQMGRESDAGNFGIDIEQDLVNAVTGRSTDLKLGKTISGKDSLSVSVKVDINNVGPFLKECLDSFVSDKYKTDFGWIDQIKAIKDPTTISMLDAWLVKSLSERSLDRIWMAPPTVLDWVDVKGFRYGGKVRPKIHADLDARTFLNESKDKTVTVATLKSKSVYAISSKTDDILDSWSAYKCFYAEYKDDSHVYILNNGRWYKVAEGFTQEVISDFDAIPESTLELPPYKHGDEGHYNSSLGRRLINP